MNTRKPKLLQYTDKIGDVRDSFNSEKHKPYKREHVLSAHSQNSFENCIDMVNSDTKLKVLIVYENLLNCGNSENVDKLMSISDALDIIVVCGTQASLDYLWENKHFLSIFTELNSE